MTSAICRLLCCGFVLLATVLQGQQQTTTLNFTNLNISVPDDDPSGVQSSETIAGLSGTITSLQVSLNLSGTPDAFNGDYFIELVNGDDAFAILVNRAGVMSGNPYGYGDNGFDVTFSDSATDDIHFYQNVAYALNAGGQLTGTWQPDGENIPATSEDPSEFDNALNQQTATLSSFVGQDPNGVWTLYLADVDGGGTGELANWSLTLVTSSAAIAVPEPSTLYLVLVGVIFLLVILKKRSRTR